MENKDDIVIQRPEKRAKIFPPNSVLSQVVPDELVFEIMSRLSVRSLLRFMSVSKPWASLISKPCFVEYHFELAVKNPSYARHMLIFTSRHIKSCPLSLVLNHQSADAVILDYPLSNDGTIVWVLGTCNGLIFLATKVKQYDDSARLFIWNPATRTSLELPGSFDHPGVDETYGFGYDKSTNDYKVAGVFAFVVDSDQLLVDAVLEVFSVRTGSWKRIEDYPGGLVVSITHVNGYLIWSSNRGDSSDSSDSNRIASLNLASETCSEFSLPPLLKGGFTLGALGEKLCVHHYHKSYVEVWVMNEYGVAESWSKLASIPYVEDPVWNKYLVPLSISGSGEILLELEGDLMMYDANTNSFMHPRIHNLGAFREVNTYVESLFSPYVDSRPERHQ